MESNIFDSKLQCGLLTNSASIIIYPNSSILTQNRGVACNDLSWEVVKKSVKLGTITSHTDLIRLYGLRCSTNEYSGMHDL